MARIWTPFLIAWAGLILLWQPGVYLNDEFVQVAGLAGLQEGRAWITGEIPDAYKGFPFVWQHWMLPGPGERAAVAGSPMLNALALPVRMIMGPLSSAAGTFGSLVLMQGAVIGACAAFLAAQKGVGRRRIIAVASTPVALLVAGVPWFGQPLEPSPFYDLAALQFVSILVSAIGAAFLYDLINERQGPRVALWVTLAYLAATPALNWVGGAKYHALAMTLVILAAWLVSPGAKSTGARIFAAGGVAGLAIWNQAPLGIVLLGALGYALLIQVLARGAPLGRWLAAGTAGFGFGLVPEVLQRILHHRSGVSSQFFSFFDFHAHGSSVAASTPTGGLQRFSVWHDPLEAGRAYLHSGFWPESLGHAPVPVLWLAPWLVAGLWFAALHLRRTWSDPVAGLAAMYCAALLGIWGGFILENGAGLSYRHILTLWPLLILFAAPWIAKIANRPRSWEWVAAGAATAFIVTAAMFVARAAEWSWRPFNWDADVLASTWIISPILMGGLMVAALKRNVDGALAISCWGLGASAMQMLIWQLIEARAPGMSADFIAWPVQMLSEAVQWLLWYGP